MMLWSSLQRVDVRRSGEHSWVLKNISSVEIAGHLFASVNGSVNTAVG
jgi:hypothetical protein